MLLASLDGRLALRRWASRALHTSYCQMQMLKLHRKKQQTRCVWASHFSPFTCNRNPSLAAMWKASMVCLTASSVAFGKERMDRMPGVISDGKPNEDSRFLDINQLQLITSLMVNRFLGSTVRRPCVAENRNDQICQYTYMMQLRQQFFFFCSCYLIVTRNLIYLTLYNIFRLGRDVLPCFPVEIKVAHFNALHNCCGVTLSTVGVKRCSTAEHCVL